MKSPQTHTSLEPKTTDLNAYLRMMDVASISRQMREAVDKQLNIDDEKEAIKQKLIAAAKETGEPLTEEDATAAVESFFSGLYSFKEPRKNLSYRLAETYVNRVKIGKVVGIPLISAGVVIGGADLASKGIKAAQLRAAEHKVERAVEGAYQKEMLLESEARELSSTSLEGQLQSGLDQIVSQSQSGLRSTSPFFTQFCKDGTASEEVTRTNYMEVESNLPAINKTLSSAEETIAKGKQMVETQRSLVSTRQSLDSLIGEIRSERPPQTLLQRAESIYESGITSVKSRQLSQGQAYKDELGELKGIVREFAVLPSRVEQLYQSIKVVAKEKEAADEADKLYNEAKSYIQNVDINPLKKSVANLEELSAILNQDFELRIVTREGVKSGIDRYYTDENGRRSSGYYLIVEAVDRNGNVIPQNIRNEENGRVENVSIWGERVPESIYESVKEDKVDDGIIQKDKVGEKARGFLRLKMLYSGLREREGQITEW